MQTNSLKSFFFRFPLNIAKIFSPTNLLWQFLAILLTFLSVTLGLDWQYYLFGQRLNITALLFPAVFLGFIVPVFLPLILLIWGAITKSGRILNTAFAITQAAALGWAVSALYKTLTGRPGPPMGSPGSIDISHIFNFGILKGGVFWGWPSSHATVAFAVSVCLVALFPDKKIIRILAIIYAAYVAIGVSMTIHWFSDAVAGIIFGSIVGFVVGKSFFQRGQMAKK